MAEKEPREDTEGDELSETARQMRAAEPYISAVWKLVGGAVVGVLGGYFLDRWLGTSPWFLLGLSLVGIWRGLLRLPPRDGSAGEAEAVKEHGAETFRLHAGLAAVVSVVGLAVAALAPRGPEARLAAVMGVGLAAVTGAVALVLKRRAVRKDLNAALKVVGVVFGMRAVVRGGGSAVGGGARVGRGGVRGRLLRHLLRAAVD